MPKEISVLYNINTVLCGVSNQSFSCNVLARTVSNDSALLCSFLCIMLDSGRVLFIVKCSCSPRIYDTLIIIVHNNNDKLANTDGVNVQQ